MRILRIGRKKCKTGPCNKDCHWSFLVKFTLILALFNWPVVFDVSMATLLYIILKMILVKSNINKLFIIIINIIIIMNEFSP